jgi:hypothetical protein
LVCRRRAAAAAAAAAQIKHACSPLQAASIPKMDSDFS